VISRRTVCLWIPSFAAGYSLPLTGHADASTINLDLISSIIQNAASIIKNVAEGIEASYRTATFIIDDQKARHARNSLEAIESLDNQLIVGQAPLLWQIENYELNNGFWPAMRATLGRVALLIQGATGLLNSLAPDLPPTLSDEISQLASLYQGRMALADIIMSLPEPKTQADLDALKNLGRQWSVLHKELIHLNTALANALPSQPRN
jgi:hypothetical protein